MPPLVPPVFKSSTAATDLLLMRILVLRSYRLAAGADEDDSVESPAMCAFEMEDRPTTFVVVVVAAVAVVPVVLVLPVEVAILPWLAESRYGCPSRE